LVLGQYVELVEDAQELVFGDVADLRGVEVFELWLEEDALAGDFFFVLLKELL